MTQSTPRLSARSRRSVLAKDTVALEPKYTSLDKFLVKSLKRLLDIRSPAGQKRVCSRVAATPSARCMKLEYLRLE